MKPILLYKVQVYGGNFFCATFFNTISNKQFFCYRLDDEQYHINGLMTIIRSCLLIGHNNSLYDDIILNYISYQDSINTKELYELSSAINKQIELGHRLQDDKDIEFYMYGNVDSVDLKHLSFFSDSTLDIPFDYNLSRHVLREDLGKIMDYGIATTQNNLDVLNCLKRGLNDGYKKKISIQSSETAEKRYIELKLGL